MDEEPTEKAQKQTNKTKLYTEGIYEYFIIVGVKGWFF